MIYYFIIFNLLYSNDLKMKSAVVKSKMKDRTKKVRLSEEYIKTIKTLALKYFNSDYVMIFGSRADSSRKGGDIDIYIQTSKKDGILEAKIKFLRDFELKLGEQKVDLVVQSGGINKKIFRIAQEEGVLI